MTVFAQAMLHIDIEWHAPLPEGPAILAANHPSTIDPAVLTVLSRERMSILIRESLFKVPLFGRSLRFSGHIPVVFGSGQEALDQAQALLAQGRKVAIFPEGIISPVEGGFHRPRSGVGRLALASGVPVVPVGIHLDKSRIELVQTHVDGEEELGAWYFRGPYAITVGEAQSFSGHPDDRTLVRSVSDQVMHRISRLSELSALRIRTTARLEHEMMVSAAAWKIPLMFFWSALSLVWAG